jgi:hypothetical protein
MTITRNESGHHDTDDRFTSHIPHSHNRTCTSPSLARSHPALRDQDLSRLDRDWTTTHSAKRGVQLFRCPTRMDGFRIRSEFLNWDYILTQPEGRVTCAL